MEPEVIAYLLSVTLVVLTVVGIACAGPGSRASRGPADDTGISLATLAWLTTGFASDLVNQSGNLDDFLRLAWWSLFGVLAMVIANRVTNSRRYDISLMPTLASSTLPTLWGLVYLTSIITSAADRAFYAISIAWSLWLLGYLAAAGIQLRRRRPV